MVKNIILLAFAALLLVPAAGAQEAPKMNKKNLVVKEWNSDPKGGSKVLDHHNRRLVRQKVRTALNDPWGTTSGSQQTNKSGRTYYNYTPAGYSHLYNNRYRGIVGADWKITKQHMLSPYILLDYVSEYEIDTNSEGTRLFSAGYDTFFRVSAGLSYTFCF